MSWFCIFSVALPRPDVADFLIIGMHTLSWHEKQGKLSSTVARVPPVTINHNYIISHCLKVRYCFFVSKYDAAYLRKDSPLSRRPVFSALCTRLYATLRPLYSVPLLCVNDVICLSGALTPLRPVAAGGALPAGGPDPAEDTGTHQAAGAGCRD